MLLVIASDFSASTECLAIFGEVGAWNSCVHSHAGGYCRFAYSALACLRMGMSWSAFFQSVRRA